MVTITVNFDSNKVGIYDGKSLIEMPVHYSSLVLKVLVEVLNVLAPKDVTLESISEGVRRTVDEY
jgi:hypothetical protein